MDQGLLTLEDSWSHSVWHTTLGRTPLDERPARRRDLHLTTHNIHKRQISMPPAWFEPTIPASERPQAHTLDRASTGIGSFITACFNLKLMCMFYAFDFISLLFFFYLLELTCLTTISSRVGQSVGFPFRICCSCLLSTCFFTSARIGLSEPSIKDPCNKILGHYVIKVTCEPPIK